MDPPIFMTRVRPSVLSASEKLTCLPAISCSASVKPLSMLIP